MAAVAGFTNGVSDSRKVLTPEWLLNRYPNNPRISNPGPITELPAEIVTEFYQWIDDLQDAMCFGLTSTYFWMCGEKTIHKLYHDRTSPILGHSLICLGDYARDLPAGCGSQSQLIKYAEALDVPSFFDGLQTETDAVMSDSNSSHNFNEKENGSVTSADEWDTVAAEFIKEELWGEIPGLGTLKLSIEPYKDLVFLEEHNTLRTWFDTSETKIPPGEMILRNLTKRLYVMSDALNIDDGAWGLGKAIMCHICWSSDDSASMSYDGSITRGIWAGDKFDIVPLESLGGTIESLDKAGWKDVTSEVRDKIVEIWKSEFGNKWEENLTGLQWR